MIIIIIVHGNIFWYKENNVNVRRLWIKLRDYQINFYFLGPRLSPPYVPHPKFSRQFMHPCLIVKTIYMYLHLSSIIPTISYGNLSFIQSYIEIARLKSTHVAPFISIGRNLVTETDMTGIYTPRLSIGLNCKKKRTMGNNHDDVRSKFPLETIWHFLLANVLMLH